MAWSSGSMLLKDHVMAHLGFFLLGPSLRVPLLRSPPSRGAGGDGVTLGQVEEGPGEHEGGEEPGPGRGQGSRAEDGHEVRTAFHSLAPAIPDV